MFVAVAALVVAGAVVWFFVWFFGSVEDRIANEMEALAAAAKIDTHCDAGETPAGPGEPMSEGKCISDEFRFVITGVTAIGQ